MAVHAPPVVLTFGASDPTGATGVMADATTCAAMGCHAAGVVTVVSVQDSVRVQDAQPVDDELVDDQARAVLEDMPVAAFKIGAVGNSDNAQKIAEILSDYDDVPVVLDPWFGVASADGEESRSALEQMTALCELLLPQTTVLTVDLELARRLSAVAAPGTNEAEGDADADLGAAACARQLLAAGAEYVLLTGVQTAGGRTVNTLFGPDGGQQNESVDRVDLRFRGAGDTLSAAIAALLAQGIDISDAVREAHDFLGQALAAGYRLGMGAAMPDRLFWAGDEGEADNLDDD
jgi:hydroxymethylpyrimidine/phosphomethylpyrimidine kinase